VIAFFYMKARELFIAIYSHLMMSLVIAFFTDYNCCGGLRPIEL